MYRNLVFAIVLVLAMGPGVASAQDDPGSIDPFGQNIVYWHQYNSGAQLDTINALIEEFNATNEFGITVEGLSQGGYNDIRELMNAAIISGETPNLVAGFQGDAASYALDDTVIDLMPYFNDATWGYSDEEQADFNQSILDVNVFDYEPFNGAMLAWPNQVSANVLAVNLTMLAELGFDGPPEDFETFTDIACAATESGLTGAEDQEVQGYPIRIESSNYETYLASFGGEMIVDGQYNFTSEAAINALQFYADLYASGCAYIPDSAFGNTDEFALGINPMALGSTAGIPFIEGGFEEGGVEADWTTTTTPWVGEQTIQLFIPSVIALESTPEENLATWLFIKFLAETSSQMQWSEATAYFPLRISAADGLTAPNDYFASANAIVSDPDVRIYTAPNLISYNTVRGLIAEAVADVTVNGMDVAEVAAQLEVDANEALADSME